MDIHCLHTSQRLTSHHANPRCWPHPKCHKHRTFKVPICSAPNHLKHIAKMFLQHQAVCCPPTSSQIPWNKKKASPRSEHLPCKDTRLYVANLQHAKSPETQHQPTLWAPTVQGYLGCMLPTYSTPNHLKHNTSPRSEHPPCKGTRLYVANLQHPKSPETQHQPTLWAPTMQGY